MTLIIFVIISLATWRTSNLFVLEDGPFHVLRALREAAGIEHDEEGQILLIPDKNMPKILSCVWCFSLWAGLGWTALWILLPEITVIFALPFAFSTIAILINGGMENG